jgi:hypothetical protein
VAREYLTGWVEARALKEATAAAIAGFVNEDIICRYGVPRELIVDGGPENKGELKKLAEEMGMFRCQVMPYHPESNGVVERGHKAIADALSKLTEGSREAEWHWREHLPAVLWADRTTAKRTTGYAPYRLMFGSDCVLPIETTSPTWNVAHWKDIEDTESLLAMRARQLERRTEDIEEAKRGIEESRAEDKRRHDAKLDRPHPINVGDWVLLHETRYETSHNTKLKNKWKGPYIVIEQLPNRNAYRLTELDGTPLREDVQAGSRLKYFYRRKDHPALSLPAGNEGIPPTAWNESAEEETYEVKDIVGERTIGGQLQYLVEWAGYDKRTWEPISNLDGCLDTVEAYRKRKKRRKEKEDKRMRGREKD